MVLNQKKLIRKLRKYRWERFLTRPYDPLFLSMHVNVYRYELKKLIGLKFNNFIYFSRNGLVDIYRDFFNVQKVDGYLYKLLKNKSSKIEKLLRHSEKALNEIKIINKTRIQPNYSLSNFKKHFKKLAHLFVRITSVPFYLGNIIESSFESDESYYRNVIRKIESYRTSNYYHRYQEAMLYPFLKSFAKINKTPLYLVRQLIYQEIIEITNSQKKINKKKLIQRKKKYAFILTDNQYFLTTDRNFLIKLENILKPPLSVKNELLKGKIAYAGKATGRVYILNHLSDMINFKKNQIIVSVSTNPELLPVLKKASAIVTEEGGMTSHAAIISRELKIPCIVGTKIATKIFKTGDRVEVDAERGIVKKI